jgi:hypothetical protein
MFVPLLLPPSLSRIALHSRPTVVAKVREKRKARKRERKKVLIGMHGECVCDSRGAGRPTGAQSGWFATFGPPIERFRRPIVTCRVETDAVAVKKTSKALRNCAKCEREMAEGRRWGFLAFLRCFGFEFEFMLSILLAVVVVVGFLWAQEVFFAGGC